MTDNIRRQIEVVESEINEQKDPNALGQLYALLHKLNEQLEVAE